jgi:hypothetical protein
MMLATRGFTDDLRVTPVQTTEMVRKRNAG